MQFLGHELPREGDGFALEIVGEGEVAQHFKEGVMTGGAAHVFKVVVLAGNAQALLRGGGAAVGTAFLTEIELLELHHAGVGEEQRGVVLGNKGRKKALWHVRSLQKSPKTFDVFPWQ